MAIELDSVFKEYRGHYVCSRCGEEIFEDDPESHISVCRAYRGRDISDFWSNTLRLKKILEKLDAIELRLSEEEKNL